MVPDGDNVYGLIVTPLGLHPVLRAINRLVDAGRVYIKKSQFDGTETLHVRTDTAGFDSTHLPEAGQHLLNGAVGGSPEQVVEFVRALSASLSEAGIKHQFEVCDGEKLVQTLPD